MGSKAKDGAKVMSLALVLSCVPFTISLTFTQFLGIGIRMI